MSLADSHGAREYIYVHGNTVAVLQQAPTKDGPHIGVGFSHLYDLNIDLGSPPPEIPTLLDP